MLGEHFIDVFAFGAFEGSQIRPLRPGSMQISIVRPWHVGQRGRGIRTNDGSGRALASGTWCSCLNGGSTQHLQPPIRGPRRSKHAALHGQRLFNIAHILRRLPGGLARALNPFSGDARAQDWSPGFWLQSRSFVQFWRIRLDTGL